MPKRILQGVVVSEATDKTVIVRVERRIMHPLYKKFIRRSKKFMAHDETNGCKVGRPGVDPGKPAFFETQDLAGPGRRRLGANVGRRPELGGPNV